MASPSSQQGAREALPPDQLTALYSLKDKFVNASALNRHARAAELSARAALKAEALLGDDSLVVADLRMAESHALVGLTIAASGAEKAALRCRSWSALLSVIALLQRRLASDTLLFGTVRKEESDYYAHAQASIFAAKNKPVPSPADLKNFGPTIGYSVLLSALYRSLSFLKSFQSWWPDAQRKIVESFVCALPPLLHAADACLYGASLFRCFKPWISSLAQLVWLDNHLLEKLLLWHSSKKKCPHNTMSLLSAPPCSENGASMR